MIRNSEKRSDMEHAIAVQQRRVNAGKFGYAKAVRRWLKHVIDPKFSIKLLAVLHKEGKQEKTETA